MKFLPWLVFLLSLMLAQGLNANLPTPHPGEPGLSINYPPRTLPKDTVLKLLDAHRQVVWKSGQPTTAEMVAKAAYLKFQLAKLSYTYPIAENLHTLNTLVIWVGTRQISLETLLHSRGYRLSPRGQLQAIRE